MDTMLYYAGPLQDGFTGLLTPRLIYTATHVETGARVIASSVDFSARDFPHAIDANQMLGGSMSLLDAAYSSARFPGISRPGTLIDRAVEHMVM